MQILFACFIRRQAISGMTELSGRFSRFFRHTTGTGLSDKSRSDATQRVETLRGRGDPYDESRA